jgi:hypothetical protein
MSKLTLQQHMRNARAAKQAMLDSGELPASAAGGRHPKPTKCARCGLVQPSFREAFVHCRTKRRAIVV